MYTISVTNNEQAAIVLDLVRRRIQDDGRFAAQLDDPVEVGRRKNFKRTVIRVRRVRLTEAKLYCGQHPGECFSPPGVKLTQKRHRYLEWEDWIEFNGVVNDAIDESGIHAEVWSNPPERMDTGKTFWIRRGGLRRVEYEWFEEHRGIGVPLRIWNHGTADQFAQEGASRDSRHEPS